jgi:hypothetical protein
LSKKISNIELILSLIGKTTQISATIVGILGEILAKQIWKFHPSNKFSGICPKNQLF